ncbi:MAG: DNA repair protein RadA [Gammaproteobacteria bacterium]|nr:DNA repair protein RadA [Gammaproteobacteria bacterium]
MSSKTKTAFCCAECDFRSPKWVGQCPDCGAWNSLVESLASAQISSRFPVYGANPQLQRLNAVALEEQARVSSGLPELDRVLGGGLVAGSAVLIGGDPGIGKSTLLLQALAQLSLHYTTIYVTGEESVQQVALRARRLGLDAPELQLLAENRLETVLELAQSTKPAILVADSIQTLYSELLQSTPGSVAQVRECAAKLVSFAKQTGAVVILVGHVTKEGMIAGPRILEHMVDTVLYFEGDRSSSFRLIRAIKNRFGAVNEIGVFAMTERGLREVTNPSAMFVSRTREPAPGSVVLATLEGTRPLLVEVQALVDRSPLANPRRLTVGLEQNRLAMLLAMLHRHAGFALYDHDVFVNVVGGVRVTEPAADLAVVLAIVSSLRSEPVAAGTVVFGEVGLAGEVRPVQRGADRLREADKLGFGSAVMPLDNRSKQFPKQLDLITVGRVTEALTGVGLN